MGYGWELPAPLLRRCVRCGEITYRTTHNHRLCWKCREEHWGFYPRIGTKLDRYNEKVEREVNSTVKVFTSQLMSQRELEKLIPH